MHLILSVRVYPRETGPFKVASDQSPLMPIFTYQVCQLQRILFCKVSGAWSLQYNLYPFPLPKKNRGQSLSGCPLPNLRVVDWIRKVATKDMCLSRICRWTLDKPSVSREPDPRGQSWRENSELEKFTIWRTPIPMSASDSEGFLHGLGYSKSLLPSSLSSWFPSNNTRVTSHINLTATQPNPGGQGFTEKSWTLGGRLDISKNMSTWKWASLAVIF